MHKSVHFYHSRRNPSKKKKKGNIKGTLLCILDYGKKKKKRIASLYLHSLFFFFPFSTNVFASLFFLVHRETEANQR